MEAEHKAAAATVVLPQWPQWPQWPIADERTLEALQEVLDSGRWAISGPLNDPAKYGKAKEQQFAEQFADYCGARHCVTMDHGTSALIAALEALDIGFGDEVIVPGLMWVAPAIAVLSVNGVPVMADIDPATLCISVNSVEAHITPRTRAIIAIHMYGCMADMDALRELADKHGLVIVEDAAHSHGAVWRGRKAGTLGDIGVFSMQQGKVLTCGEGGAAVTNDPVLKGRMEASAWNARKRIEDTPTLPFSMGLTEGLYRFGTNRCLSEFQAAVLLDQLPRLDGQNALRESNARYLDRELSQIPGVLTVEHPEQIDSRTYYGYVIRIDSERFGCTAEELIDRLQLLLGMGDFLLHPVYKPLYRNPLYTPHPRRHAAIGEAYADALATADIHLPGCELIYEQAVVFHHSVLLAARDQLSLIVAAIRDLHK
ncbi:L-glutamine:scyllo-inosose aminotransferase/L-glutamine:2-deoxy-scyllo-inosose/3-amino-2,3-dideoxy-scyllo-inosose aminotransferase [Paenibacillus cellulosilyticus]|uniref:L-glutamine:scyllo-inosose aminotransferase/L-glutamine:2-deoxy-scyllo-inosose/3-amino-2,3-dideoxy-scyllo-inosose aminotransferase n=1 Tax=Paenibacillus cellulosilyticus TaxID=375489 RepID=A0A2V2YXT3_9BACL|nr:DegT/DnrJ/EryC1/StrS family aminotransferase [Paenibacillus cellulosilyticus]PWW06552.1 L-glutamine:scyllo-inosose aminotransferase/L-glutamine:2-deoxy-scyllo-inosose/3-amino-2,3-dideoxy-scyllo-inosose aminotransferase [Paenibacillus cellulosilyticus]QKS46112.1 DegT/DnrJ/EryC1/StrS family aminotransferase [Paenibacillus cellulosilyticus]